MTIKSKDPEIIDGLIAHFAKTGRECRLLYNPAIPGLEEAVADAARNIAALYQAYGHQAIKMEFEDVEEQVCVLRRVRINVIKDRS